MSTTADDRELESILRDYLEAEDAGATPSRDDFLNSHSSYRAELTAYFETADRVAGCKNWLVPTPPAAALGTVAGYRIEGEIGRGGMGVVYKAVHPVLGRTVALKLLQVDDAGTAGRLLAEARAAARLDHPGIVPIYEVGDHGGRPFLAMAFVAGETLAAHVQRGALDGKFAARIVRDVALAVQHAHDHGVIHRDLKPSNILVTPDGQPKVTDFGLAKRSGEATLSPDGSVLGTPAYMPPEFAAGYAAHAGPAADVYGLGAVFYTLLTGRPPFSGETLLETMRAVADSEPAPPRTVDRTIACAAEAICLRCLEKDPRHRYDTAKALAEDLDRYLEDEVPLAERLGWRDWLNRKLDRAVDFGHARAWSRLLAAAAALFLLAHVGFYLATGEGTTAAGYWMAFLATLLATVWLPCLAAGRLPRLDSRDREIVLFWFGVSVGQVVLFANHCPLHGEIQAAEVGRAIAAAAVLYGVMFFALGRLYWGRLYQLGLAGFAAAVVVMNAGCLAPIAFGAWQAVAFSAVAWHLRGVARGRKSTTIAPGSTS